MRFRLSAHKNLAPWFGVALCSTLFWVCSKNPPLDPTRQVDGQFVVLVGLDSEPPVVPPGGSAVVRAVLMDQNNQPVAGEVVDFSTNLGVVLPASATTNDSGVATTIFTAPQQPGRATVVGRYKSSFTKSVEIEIKDTAPQTVTLLAGDESLLANGLTSTSVQSIWRTEDGTPLKGLPVTFEATLGTLPAAAVTDSFGMAQVEFTSPALRSDAVATITARGNDSEASTQILLKGVEFSLSVSPQSLIADGRSRSRVRVVLKEAGSTIAISGARVSFGTSLGTIPNSALTNASGVAEVDLTSSNQTGTATVTAIYGERLTETAQVAFSASVPTNLTVSADPPEILADNRSTSIITAVVSDQANNPISDGTPVTFAIVKGSGTIQANQVTTDGVAVSTLTSGTQPDTATVVVSVGQLSDTTFVRYVVGDPAGIVVTADSSSLPADGQTATRIVARVFDTAGNAVVDGTKVDFTSDLGDVTPSAQTVDGQAVAQFKSSVTGTATIRASAGAVSDELTIDVRPGPANSILLTFDPTSLGVKDSGRNQTVSITADVVDSRNNPVADGTFIAFSLFSSPGGGEFLSATTPLPTVNGRAQVSLNSGIRSGSVRIMAQVTDSLGTPVMPEVRAVSTEIIIFAGPPYIENVNDPATSHLTVGVQPLNVLGWNVVNNTAVVTAVVGDKFNNPVPPGTAVFFTTTGGVISTHTGFTNEEGVATVTIHTAQPYPTISRYYNTFFDPNEMHPDFNKSTNVIPGPIPDFDNGEVLNSQGDFGENDGVARILAVTEGVDANGNPARAWSVADLVFSGAISVFDVQTSATDLSPGETAVITFKIYDVNGNPITPGSEITVQTNAGQLSWTALTTGDPGTTRYEVLLTNNLDPTDPAATAQTANVTIVVNSANGNMIRSSPPINLNLN